MGGIVKRDFVSGKPDAEARAVGRNIESGKHRLYPESADFA
jgi:hypothetical protein